MAIADYKAARDFLLASRGDYDTAYRDFRWPRLDRFNWALDWFDAELARGVLAHRPALKIVGALRYRLERGWDRQVNLVQIRDVVDE